MKKILLFLVLVGVLSLILSIITTNVSLAATCDSPTGTITVDKAEAGAGEPFKITVTGKDDNDVWYLYVCYYDANNNFICDDQKCSGQQNDCTKEWTFMQSEPGIYTFYGKIRDSDNEQKYGCAEFHDADTEPAYMQVTVGPVTEPCEFSMCDGPNFSPCVCGKTPIRGAGQYCCSNFNNGEGKEMSGLRCPYECSGAIVDVCPSESCGTQFKGNCLCGGRIINNQFCCPSSEAKGFYDKGDCQAACASPLKQCPDPSCQNKVTEECLCGSSYYSAKPGQFCCAASNKIYDNKNSCEADTKCLPTANTCGQLFGNWCSSGQVCDGTNRTSEASDKDKYPNQICCSPLNNLGCTEPKPCAQWGGAWCPAGNTCDGTDLAFKVSDGDKNQHSGQICCLGICYSSASHDTSGALSGKLEVAWPPPPMGGGTLSADSNLTDLIRYFYGWGISLGGFAAFIALIIAGFQYLTSAGDAGRMRNAMGRIRSAGIGLVLLFGSFIILNTINPQLTKLEEPKLPPPQDKNWGEEGFSFGYLTATEPCKNVKLFEGLNFVTDSPIQPPSEITEAGWEKDFGGELIINSIKMTGGCQITLYQLSGQKMNADYPAVPIPSETKDIGGTYGVNKFKSIRIKIIQSGK